MAREEREVVVGGARGQLAHAIRRARQVVHEGALARERELGDLVDRLRHHHRFADEQDIERRAGRRAVVGGGAGEQADAEIGSVPKTITELV